MDFFDNTLVKSVCEESDISDELPLAIRVVRKRLDRLHYLSAVRDFFLEPKDYDNPTEEEAREHIEAARHLCRVLEDTLLWSRSVVLRDAKAKSPSKELRRKVQERLDVVQQHCTAAETCLAQFDSGRLSENSIYWEEEFRYGFWHAEQAFCILMRTDDNTLMRFAKCFDHEIGHGLMPFKPEKQDEEAAELGIEDHMGAILRDHPERVDWTIRKFKAKILTDFGASYSLDTIQKSRIWATVMEIRRNRGLERIESERHEEDRIEGLKKSRRGYAPGDRPDEYSTKSTY